MRLLVLCLALSSATSALASSLLPSTIEQLFGSADAVALVRVTGGDTVAFERPWALYRAEVLEWFKGVPQRPTVYFGPFAGGTTLGGEYFVFLRSSGKSIRDLSSGPVAPWPASLDEPVFRVMFEGFGQLEVEYVCVFEPCDGPVCCAHGVSVAADHVILPNQLPVFRQKCDSRPFDTAWVKKEAFVLLLRRMRAAQQGVRAGEGHAGRD